MASVGDKMLEPVEPYLRSFMESPRTRPVDIDHLISYIRHDPPEAEIQSLVPADEIEERLEIARKIATKRTGPPSLTTTTTTTTKKKKKKKEKKKKTPTTRKGSPTN
jgi:hypothetical protein